MKIVIRAGGSGTRLWPLSRAQKPKQFLPFLGMRSLVEEKVRSIRPLIASHRDLYVSVAAPFVQTVQKLIPQLPRQNIIAEPIGRNTGTAIALESVIIEAATRGREDPVIASLTADDVFGREPHFRSTLRAAEQFLHVHPQWVVTIASKVKDPDPGLSYIGIGRTVAHVRGQAFHTARRWVEKPKRPLLTRLMRSPSTFAHTGLYVWKTSTILSLFEEFQPKVMEGMRRIQAAIGTPKFERTLRHVYATLPSMSIEEAVARHAKNIAVAAGDFGWSDTGKWYLVKNLLAPGKRNLTRGDIIAHNVEDSLVYAPVGKPVGVVGLAGVIVVDTGDALLVCGKESSDDVKHIVAALKARRSRYL